MTLRVWTKCNSDHHKNFALLISLKKKRSLLDCQVSPCGRRRVEVSHVLSINFLYLFDLRELITIIINCPLLRTLSRILHDMGIVKFVSNLSVNQMSENV